MKLGIWDKYGIFMAYGINMKNPNRKNEEQGCTYILV